MNLTCVICAELFIPADDVHVTPCGHLFHYTCLCQWLERSKTCPQCRNKCLLKSVRKVYFNLSNLDSSQLDAGSLQDKLDDLKLKGLCMQNELKLSKEEITILKENQKKCKTVIKELEKKCQSEKFATKTMSEQINVLKSEVQVVNDQHKEIKRLKMEIELHSSLQAVLKSTLPEVENLIKESNPQSLAASIVLLKRELRYSDQKRESLRNTLSNVNHDFRSERDSKKLLEEKLSQLESENYNLKRQLQKNNELQNSIENLNTVIVDNPTAGANSIEFDEKNQSPLSISRRIKLIEESSSPYLNIKSSSIGLSPLMKCRDKIKEKKSNLKISDEQNRQVGVGAIRKNTANLEFKYSIFKKPRLIESTPLIKSSNLAFNGLGGSEKKIEMNFECNPIKPNVLQRTKSGNLKKLASNNHFNLIDKFFNDCTK